MVPRLRCWTVVFSFCLLLAARTAARAGTTAEEQKIIELYQDGKLFDGKQYKTVRTAFSQLFEARHAEVMRRSFGDDHEALTKWLDSKPNFKQNLFTALDERYDKVGPALTLVRALWKKFPRQLEQYPDLGIAVAVTWDDPRAVYDYVPHQVRTKSTLPQGLLDGLANFQYLVENDKLTEGRCKYLPWEFLLFVVDHKTPLAERAWAQKYYLANRNSKSWHQDVPYDKDMLKAEREKTAGLGPHLAGLEYTLANIRKYGGVCAMQADFAARVAKSVGIPAVYCSGQSAYRGHHAWWMYVAVQKATVDQVQFTLRSDGRLVGFIKDAFYTGEVLDPHTGRKMLDRDMERRLSLVGRDRIDHRQAALLMRAYPWLAARLFWDVNDRVAFLDKTIRLCPQADEPWLEFAHLIKSKQLTAEQKTVIKTHVSKVLTYFSNYPDFVARVFTDLLVVFEPAEQVKLNQQAITLCEKASRPDLSCDLRLRSTDALVAQKKWQTAADGLVSTINRFPTEGRYVPKLLLKLQEVSPNYKGGNERLARLYLDLVPRLFVYYKGDQGKDTYQRKLYEQALRFFEMNQMQKYASELRARVGS